ncbi:hypothetical protein [Aquimonas voraii]|uniref:TonB protein C-terminal n=1 Tax=Aquimonas voraii TaxID=265719 RepID=A0A1G6VZ89_9GAMM|nr:hypothetical protein [Aquimonas voraii]SDD58878.1 hypothetical protein SAMN04488509_10436 [Aquimonas voraii]
MRLSLTLILALLVAPPLSAAELPTVDRTEFDRLWRVATERMAPTAPPLAIETAQLIRKHGEIVIEHEFVIDGEGTPSGYKLLSIEPPDVDPRPFMAMAMFWRYRPVEGVPPTPVLFRDTERFRMPKPAAEGEE